MRPWLLLSAAATFLVAAALFGAGCRRRAEPARPMAPPPASAALDMAEARQARERRAEAVAGLGAQPGVAVERCPVLPDPDFGAPPAGTLEKDTPVEVLLVEPGFYGIRTAGGGLAFVPARSVRLLPGVLGTPSATSRPRHEIVPQIVPLTPEAGTPAPGIESPAAAESPTAGAGR
jgi:hypothetical protein